MMNTWEAMTLQFTTSNNLSGHCFIFKSLLRKENFSLSFERELLGFKQVFLIICKCSISDPIRSPLHSIFVRNHLEGITACFHTFHTRSTTSVTVDKFNETNQGSVIFSNC
jgi:hypothetical protein